MQKELTKSKMMFDFLRGVKRYFALAVIFGIGSTVLMMLRPRIIEYTVDGILDSNSFALPAILEGALAQLGGVEYLKTHLYLPALVLVAVSVVAAVLNYAYKLCAVKGSEGFLKSMRDRIYDHIGHLDCQWHRDHQTGDIIQRCTTDVEEIRSFLSDQLVTLVNIVLTIGFALFFMFRVSVKLALIATVSVPVISGASLWFHQRIGAAFLRCDENEGLLSTIVQENLTGVRVVRAFGREADEKRKFAEQNRIVTESWEKLNLYLSTFWSTGDVITGGVTLAMLVFGTKECIAGNITVGGFISVMSYLAIIARPVRGLGHVISEMSKMGVSMQRLFEIMKCEREHDREGAEELTLRGDIEFDHVSYGYPGCAELLHDVSFTVPEGGSLGILGGTGSGKSTLVQLLDRLYELPEDCGSIRIGGTDIREVSAACVRRQIGLMLQEPYLFSRSIAENIAISDDAITREEIERAAEASCLSNALDKFPKGYDTFVGERGVTLSGGQKQRVAIARTLAQRKPILIFDDSMSAVDAETDAQIRENLKKSMKEATVILISHRITTLMAADQILVLDKGRIIDRGTHEELSSREGLYREICAIQSGEEDVL